jgi:RHS repeat-associated protein
MDDSVGGAVMGAYADGLQRISENQLIGGAWTPSFYGYDGHGNVRYLTSTAGAITDTYTYDAFGLPISTTGTTPNAYTYSGERFDQNLGLFHLRARDYNPLTGRFETMDPAAGDILNPATLHKYVYAGNDPVNASDPTGRLTVEVAFMYTRGGFSILAGGRIQIDPWEVLETLHEKYETYEALSTIAEVGHCDKDVLSTAAAAIGSLAGGAPFDSKTGRKASNKFLGCLYEAFRPLLNPVPGFPWGPLPGSSGGGD